MANIVITLPRKENREEKTYKLEFNRRTIIKMEEDGILEKLNKGAKQETLDCLIYYACLKNHPQITKEEAMEIIDSVSMKDYPKFVEAIMGLIEASINAIENGDNEGNAHWEAH